MNNLKELNLISVLNNIDDKRLINVVNNTDSLKLLNIIKYAKCNICNKNIRYHDECYQCEKHVCSSFYSEFHEKSVCIKCIKDEEIDLHYNDDECWIFVGYYEFEIINATLDKKYTRSTEIIEKTISYEEFLKILKDNNIKY